MSKSLQVVPLGCLIWTACTLSTEPDLSGDVYALAQVDGSPLPARVGDETWVADTIRFDAGGEWRRVEVVVLHYEGSPENPTRREGSGFVTRRGDRIVLDFTCPPNALQLCVAPDSLRREGKGLVRRANSYGRVPAVGPVFRYDPVRPATR